MKKNLLSLTLCLVFILVSTCPAFAAVLPASTGFYNIGSAAGVSITPMAGTATVTATTADADGDGKADTYYRDSDRLAVVLSGAASGYEYTISLIEGNGTPTSSSTYYYVSQVTSTSSTVNFSVVPELPTATKKLTLYINGNQPGFTPKAISLGFAYAAAMGDPPVFNGAPTVSVGSGLAMISYSATAGDAPITGYQIILNGEVKATVASNQTSYMLTGLTNGTTYTVSIIALSEYGNAQSQSVTFAPGAKPVFSTTPTVVVGNGTATINFSATASGSPITSYQVKLNGSVVATLGASETSYTFTGLTNNTTYRATVVATNAVGSTESSAVSFTPIDGSTASGSVTGTATSYINDTDVVTIELYADGAATASYTTTVTGKSATYTITGVAAGLYTMKVSKTNHITRDYVVTVGGSAVTQSVKIHPKGDIDGNGTVNIMDVNTANLTAKGKRTLNDYQFKCANIDNNTSINIMDVNRINLHSKGKTLLWR